MVGQYLGTSSTVDIERSVYSNRVCYTANVSTVSSLGILAAYVLEEKIVKVLL